MSHGIYTDRDFQVAEEMAWHKLTRLEVPTIEHFPEIEAMPLYYNGGKEMQFGKNTYVVPVAKDDSLPVAPPYCEGTYTLFTPRDAWKWVAEILEGTKYHVQSIGMLWNRSMWFISTKLSELQDLAIGGSLTHFQFNFSGGLDRKTSPQCELSATRIVCANTLNLSRMSDTVLFHERATKNFNTRLEAAKQEVEKAVGMTAVFNAAMSDISKNPCSSKMARTIFTGYVTPEDEIKGTKIEMSTRTKKTVDVLTNLHTNGLGNQGETEYDLLNAYTQHLTRGSDDSKVPLGRRFASSEFGNGADSKADFCRMLTTDRARLNNVIKRGELILA